MSESARIIIIQSCNDCPYRESVRESSVSYCATSMFQIKDVSIIDPQCQLTEVDLELDEEDEGCDCGQCGCDD